MCTDAGLTVSAPASRRRVLQALGLATGGLLASSCVASPGNIPADTAAEQGAVPPDAVALSGDIDGYRTRLLLLGTAAGPLYVAGRTGIASAVAVGDRNYLVDAGPCATRRLGQAGIGINSLAGVFVTHQHSDHMADLFNIFWLSALEQPDNAIPVFAPGSAGELPPTYGGPVVGGNNATPGAGEMIATLTNAYAYEINNRNLEMVNPLDFSARIAVHDLLPPPAAGASAELTAPDMEPFHVFEDDRVRVTAVLVPHGPVFPSYGFRFDTDEGSVTFSGDTARADNVARLATGTDVLVHETIDVDFYAKLFGGQEDAIEHMRQTHTTAQDVGRVATDAGARRVVLSHIGPGDPRQVTDQQWGDRVRETYAGPIVVGHDLTQVGVGAHS